MPEIVHRIVVVVVEVPAVHVVHEAVAVVVDAVSRDLARVGPDVRRQVGMRVIDAAVDDPDQDGVVPHGGVPGQLRRDVDARDAARLSGVVQPPLGRVARIVRGPRRLHDVIRLGVIHLRVAPQALDRLRSRAARSQAPVLGMALEFMQTRRAEVGARLAPLALGSARLELDQDVPLDVGQPGLLPGKRGGSGRRPSGLRGAAGRQGQCREEDEGKARPRPEGWCLALSPIHAASSRPGPPDPGRVHDGLGGLPS